MAVEKALLWAAKRAEMGSWWVADWAALWAVRRGAWPA
jgi:hypothetical protein